MEPKKEIKRGEMWYISAPNTNPASAALGRPGVMTNDKGCNNPEIAVVYCTTNTTGSGKPENALLTSPNRECMARCTGTVMIPRGWFQSKMCNITEDEMKDIERGLLYALGISVAREIRELKGQLSFYKALYRETLDELPRKHLAEDLAALTKEIRSFSVAYVTAEHLTEPTEEEQTAPEPTEEEELAELERQLAELEQLGPEEVELSEPEPTVEEDEPPAPKKLVNVNTASWWELHRKFEIDQDTAKQIVGEKIKRNGRFQTVEEVLELRCLSKKDIKKMEGRITVEV